LYSLDKIKPVCVIKDSHSSGWVSALAGQYNTDLVLSGAMDGKIHFYRVAPEKNEIAKEFSIELVGFG
jgi:hypothetical protein